MRPCGTPPIEISKNTRGFATLGDASLVMASQPACVQSDKSW
jgi:hypothetical protein